MTHIHGPRFIANQVSMGEDNHTPRCEICRHWARDGEHVYGPCVKIVRSCGITLHDAVFAPLWGREQDAGRYEVSVGQNFCCPKFNRIVPGVTDKELIPHLPILPRKPDGESLNREELSALAEIIRKAQYEMKEEDFET